jgi:hypothetical protein
MKALSSEWLQPSRKSGRSAAKRFAVALGIVLVAALGGVVGYMASGLRQTEPVYDGQPKGCWLGGPVAAGIEARLTLEKL